jgi:pyruvate dehydrogenase E2 component (dihydrolipoamide acetyltransferase)
MPSLGPDMDAGTLVEWRIKPGDAVKRGDVVALVETDKGIIDLEIFNDGTVEKLLTPKGARVPVGTALALMTGDAPVAPAAPTTAPELSSTAAVPATPPIMHPSAHHKSKVSPAARARAHALGIDPATLTGSGPAGVVTLADVEKAGQSRAPVSHPPDMRQVIAKAMSKSKREIPHYYLSLTCNFTAARAWLDRHNASMGIQERVLPAALLIKAVALSARALPDFNGYYGDDYVAAPNVNVGVAIAMRGGRLVAPAIMDTDKKSLAVVMAELRDLSNRVRAGHMRSTELTQATITVTSLAEDGPDVIVPIIHTPQVAMVGFGSIAERPWVVDGAVKPAVTVNVTLAADHRVTDGRIGSRFLSHVRDALQDPEKL